MNFHPSNALRVLLALVLIVGFYLLALAIGFGLLYVPYAAVVYAHSFNLHLVLICLFGALAIFSSVLPRSDSFRPPGTLLRPEQQPRLFAELEAVAKATGQAMPVEVYLLPDVNAWVGQRDGTMGFGSRRMMGLGLPLLQMLTRSQLRAVLAHEFGHYHNGDTQLGPWIYKTRAAIVRTVMSLRGKRGRGLVLQLPFRFYGLVFLRVTQAVSRHQELVADALAARVVGSKPLIEGLRTVHGMTPAFYAYWTNEYAPVMEAGFRPPIAEGFGRFVQAGQIAAAIHKQMELALQADKSGTYDTHPPLKQRIEAISHLPTGDPAPDDLPALSLLEDVPALESQLLAGIAGDAAAKLKPISWADAGATFHLRRWTSLVKVNAKALQGVTPETLPDVVADMKKFSRRFDVAATEDYHVALASTAVSAAMALLLVRQGWKPQASPGAPVVLERSEARLQPFNVIPDLACGRLTADAWRQKCTELGIQGMDLGDAATSDPPSVPKVDLNVDEGTIGSNPVYPPASYCLAASEAQINSSLLRSFW